jgi:TonB-dependent starch-binding outer membrane protein SusC
MNFKILLILLIVWAIPKVVTAQNAVTGTVTDASTNEALPGVNVLVKGTTNGTNTDTNGSYTIIVKPDDVLLFSFIGYTSVEIPVGNQSNIRVTLQPDVTQLGEVIVTGYTTQRKQDISSSISIVDIQDIAETPYSNILQSMVGRVSGVTISQDGEPGKGRTNLKIRGITTLNNNQPLYVVDGIPTMEDLSNLNPNDIESIQILKDAAAASQYGSRSAGGVVVVTTKKGKAGKLSIDAGGTYGVQTLGYRLDLLDATEWGQLQWRALRNSNLPTTHPLYGSGVQPQISTEPFLISNERQTYQFSPKGTDWYDEVYRNAPIQNYYLNVGTGGERGSMLFGLSYYNQEGLIRFTNYERLTARINSEYKIAKWLKTGENFSIAYADQVQIASQEGQDGIPLDVVRQHPLLPVRDLEGNYAGKISGFPDVRNMVSVIEKNKDNTTNSWRLFGNAYVEANLFDALEIENEHSLLFKSNFGLDLSNYYDRRFGARYQEGDYDITQNSLTNNYGIGVTTTWQNTLEYGYEVNDHSFRVFGGIESVQYGFNSLSGTRQGFESEDPNFTYLKAGSGTQTNTGDGTEWGLLSYIGKVDYAFKDGRYLLSATLRHDKTSRFTDAGTFPAFSAGWNLSEEPFLQSTFASGTISAAKLRASWGRQGNQNSYEWAGFSVFGADQNHTNYDLGGTNGTALQGSRVISRGNPFLKWETTTQFDVGAEVSFLQDKIQLSFDYYVKETADILLRAPLLAALGEGDAPFVNAATVRNKGIDVNLSHQYESKRGFSLNTNFQLTHYKNEVVSLGTGIGNKGYENEMYLSTDGPTRYATGQPMGAFYGWVADGIFQNQQEVEAHALQSGKGIGRLRYLDINEDGVINDEDRTYLGDPNPDVTMGLNLRAAYRRVSLELFFYAALGQEVYNEIKWYTDFAQSGNFNRSTRILRAWSPDNTGSSIPAPIVTGDNNEGRASSYFVEDASFVRLRSVRVGYEIPARLVKNFRVNIFGEVQNVFRLTKYSGLDPEVAYAEDANIVGIDRGVYPLPRTFTVGVTIRN